MTEDVLRRLKDANRWRVTGDHGLAPQQADRERRGRDEEQIRPAAHAGSEVDVAVPRVHRLRGRHVMSLPLGPTLLVRVKTRRFIGCTIQSRLGRRLGYQPRPPGHRSRELCVQMLAARPCSCTHMASAISRPLAGSSVGPSHVVRDCHRVANFKFFCRMVEQDPASAGRQQD